MEAIKDSSPRQEIRVDPHLTGDAKENTILVLVGKFFSGGSKNNQLLNATLFWSLFDIIVVNTKQGNVRRGDV